jgi:hypothetical protein
MNSLGLTGTGGVSGEEVARRGTFDSCRDITGDAFRNCLYR